MLEYTIKAFLAAFHIFWFLHRLLTFSYLFQIKEYRLDRVLSYMREEGIAKALYNSPFKIPARKLRNGVTIAAAVVVQLAFLAIVWNTSIASFAGFLLLTPVLAFVWTEVFVHIINIPVWIYREQKINKAEQKRDQINPFVIAVTGSYGKTSVKEALFSVLGTHASVAKTDENMNTDIGVALSILRNMKQSTEYFIAEIGAYKRGEAAKIARYVKPKAVIVTGFGNQHVDLYGSREILIESESEPLAYLPEDGVAYINGDMKRSDLRAITRKAHYRIITYTIDTDHGDITATHIRVSEEGTEATIHYRNHTFPIQTRLLGRHTIQNLLPVIACAQDQGMLHTDIQKAVAALEPVLHKLSVHKGIHGSTILSDSKNANVNGFIEAIRTSQVFHKKKTIILSKGIIELGDEKPVSYQKILKEMGEHTCELWTTDPVFEEVAGSVSKVGDRVHLFENESSLLEAIEHIANEKTLLVVEGRFSPAIKALYND